MQDLEWSCICFMKEEKILVLKEKYSIFYENIGKVFYGYPRKKI